MISKIIKKIRKQTGWTQLELSERLGYSQGSICNWELGTHLPSKKNHQEIILLAYKLNIKTK